MTTREEVVQQARASAPKLGCDPDLLELMALRIWDASIQTAVASVARRLRHYDDVTMPQIRSVSTALGLRADPEVGAEVVKIIRVMAELTSDRLNDAINDLQALR